MNQRHQGVKLFGYWFPVSTVRIIVVVIVTLVGGVVSILTDMKFLLPAVLGLLLATAWHLLFKLMVR